MLSDWPHGFFTRVASAPPQALAESLNLPGSAYSLKQVHSDTVHPAPVEPGSQGDALWTDQSGASVWVCSADCTPVLLADPQKKLVAAVHAGWRGTAQEILPKTIQALVRAGADPAALRCVLGPAIGGPVYQVSVSVAEAVTGTIPDAAAALHTDPEPGKIRLDVREVNRQQARSAGIPEQQISICPVCTFETPQWLYSYRREGAGRVQYSGIGL